MLMARELLGNPVWFNTFTRYLKALFAVSSAVYLGFAEILNEANQKTVLPIFPVK